jgi:hypothetical protein
MLRQLPVRDPDQLVVLSRIQGGQSGEHFSYPQVNYLAKQDDLFAGLCGFAADTFHIGPSDALETAAGAWVTGECYGTLGITPIIGRLLGRKMTVQALRRRQSSPMHAGPESLRVAPMQSGRR